MSEIDELRRHQNEQEALRRADEARRVLDNPLIQEAWETIEKLTVEQLAELNLAGQSEQNEYALELVRCLQANRRQRKLFEVFIRTGQLVELNIAQRDAVLGGAKGGVTH